MKFFQHITSVFVISSVFLTGCSLSAANIQASLDIEPAPGIDTYKISYRLQNNDEKVYDNTYEAHILYSARDNDTEIFITSHNVTIEPQAAFENSVLWDTSNIAPGTYDIILEFSKNKGNDVFSRITREVISIEINKESLPIDMDISFNDDDGIFGKDQDVTVTYTLENTGSTNIEAGKYIVELAYQPIVDPDTFTPLKRDSFSLATGQSHEDTFTFTVNEIPEEKEFRFLLRITDNETNRPILQTSKDYRYE